MNIDPEGRTFTEVTDYTVEGEDQEKADFLNFYMAKEITAVSTNKELLQKLQDDLRKAGYRLK